MSHSANDPLRISDDGLALIEQFEGFRADWYDDPVGVRTIGYGWTHDLPDGLEPPLSEPEARDLLRQTVGEYEAAVRRLVEVPLAQPQFDALVSFTYNLGPANLSSSTLLRLLNEGNATDAAMEFDRWVIAGGMPLAGLVRRRAAERALFESATPSPQPPMPTPPDPPPVDPDPPPPGDGRQRPARTDMERIPGRPPHPLDAGLPGPPPADAPDEPTTDSPRSGW